MIAYNRHYYSVTLKMNFELQCNNLINHDSKNYITALNFVSILVLLDLEELANE